MVFSLETSSSRYSSSVTIHRIGGTPIHNSLQLRSSCSSFLTGTEESMNTRQLAEWVPVH